jgi:hypothetical protein
MEYDEFLLMTKQAQAFCRGYKMLLEEDQKKYKWNLVRQIKLSEKVIRTFNKIILMNQMDLYHLESFLRKN